MGTPRLVRKELCIRISFRCIYQFNVHSEYEMRKYDFDFLLSFHFFNSRARLKIKNLIKCSVMSILINRGSNWQILVKKVNYVGMEEHPRDKKTSKRERELKAVIGLQEITIRNLINSLQEKAKSAEELKQTVKLAQAFSAAREESREGASDAEDSTDISSNSDRSEVTSEFEFSLSKPQVCLVWKICQIIYYQQKRVKSSFPTKKRFKH